MLNFSSRVSGLRGRRSVRKTDADRAAARLLRATIAELPSLPDGSTASEREWLDNRQQLRRRILKRDPHEFLSWGVLQKTMVASAPYVMDVELPAVRNAGWLPLITEDRAGRPSLVPGTSTSANLIHHAYHALRFRAVTGLDPADFDHVVEIGAGYGSMCRLLYRLGRGRPTFTLFDLPEFSALQNYFLSRVGVPADLVQDPDLLAPSRRPQGRTLLVATWSLSEMPIARRNIILSAIGAVDAYLFAFQDQFGEAQNDVQFAALSENMPQVDWSLEDIDHIPGSRYLFGVRRGL